MLVLIKLVIVIVIGNQSIVRPTPDNDSVLSKKIDHYLKKGEENGFSGAVLIAKKGKVVLNKGYGLANREKKQVNTSQTVFSTGSVTKQFTATAILKLAELDKLKLTDPLSKFFDKLPDDKKEITIHQLLIHSSGLVGDIGNGDFDNMSTNDFFNKLFATPLAYKPGTKHRYSNAGYSVLARIIELISGQDYERFLNQYLFRPAGMRQTGYLLPEWNRDLLAHGYIHGVTDWGTMVDRFKKTGNVSWGLKGNGGIQSTQEDMFKWYQALRSNKVISKSSAKLLTTSYIREQEGSDESFYAYGWAIFNSDRKTKIITHNGSNGIFFHEFMWLPEEDVVIILSTNAYSREAEITWRLERMIFNSDYHPGPIKKSPHFLILDFIKKHGPDKKGELLSLIKKEYGKDYDNANVLNQIGYMLMETKQNEDWVIELFKLNVELFPNNANIWDSLGDGYKNIKDKENAIISYKKALELDDTLSASINSLEELGVTVKKTFKKKIILNENILKSYTGNYKLKSGHIIKIIKENDQLFIEFPGRVPMKIFPISTAKFVIENRDAKLLFTKNDQDKIESCSIIEGGEQMKASKM